MKNFIPFLFVSLLLFIILKSTNHTPEKVPKTELHKKTSDSLRSQVNQKEVIFFEKFQQKVVQRSPLASLVRLQPSDFKAYCYFNCKLLSSSKNGLCFFPGGLSLPDRSRPLFDKTWKRQFIQYS